MNPLVAEIRAQLDAADGMVDDTIAFVLSIAAEKIRALDGWDPATGWAGYEEGQRTAADYIDPNHQEQP